MIFATRKIPIMNRIALLAEFNVHIIFVAEIRRNATRNEKDPNINPIVFISSSMNSSLIPIIIPPLLIYT